MKNISLTLLFFFTSFAAGRAQNWFQLGTGSNALKANGGAINTICIDDSGNVYAAGGFWDSTSFVNGRCYVAKWSTITHEWCQLGTGMDRLKANSGISSICLDKYGNIYAAGSFTDSTNASRVPVGHFYVAKWNGSTWSQLGTGIHALNADGSINSICADDSGNIYAAGNFRNTYGNNYVAKWDGTDWIDLGNLNANLFIYSICHDDSNNVYAAGHFTDAAGHTYVAKYSPTTGTWSELGTGFDSGSHELIIFSLFSDTANHVYAALSSNSGSGQSSNIFKWNGASWNRLGALNANHFTSTICKGDSGYIYAAGRLTNTLGKYYVSKWDPLTNMWSELGTGTLNANKEICVLYADKHGNIYTAGAFTDTISTTHRYNYVAEYGKSTLYIVQPLNNYKIEVYPNPTNNTLTITTASSPNTEITIADMYGRVVLTKKLALQKETVDVSTLAPGVYVYCVTANGTPIKAGKLEKY